MNDKTMTEEEEVHAATAQVEEDAPDIEELEAREAELWGHLDAVRALIADAKRLDDDLSVASFAASDCLERAIDALNDADRILDKQHDEAWEELEEAEDAAKAAADAEQAAGA